MKLTTRNAEQSLSKVLAELLSKAETPPRWEIPEAKPCT